MEVCKGYFNLSLLTWSLLGAVLSLGHLPDKTMLCITGCAFAYTAFKSLATD